MGSRQWLGGPTRRAYGATLALILVFFFVGGPLALAVHDEGLFELDGNATDTASAGDDWNDIDGGAIASTFITDGADPPTDTTYLHTGDSKDIKDFDEWVLTTTDEAPDKSEIVHAFAAGYNNADGDLIVYFGMDRFDASGDAQVGFWFAQDGVTVAGGNIVGDHVVGDILVLSDFVVGGKVPAVKVFRWVGSGGSDGPIDLVTTSGDPDCGAAPAGDARCAIVNTDTVDAPWAFTNKSGGNDFLAGEFYEGGINLTALGVDQGCITTFIAETRTSQSTDARLKDIAMGGFPLCGISVEKTGDRLGKIGDPAHYTITITNTGAITLYRQSIVDDVLGNLVDVNNPSVDSSDCGTSLDPGESCTIELTHDVVQGDPDPLVNTVTVVYDNNSNLTGTDVSDSDSHSLNLFQPSVRVDKGGDTLSKVGDNVHYTFTITNTSSSDSPDLLLNSISDTLLGNLADEAPAACDRLDPGESCSFGADRVVQAGDPNPLPNTVTVHYHPEGFPNDITDSDDHSVELFGPNVQIVKSGDTLGKIGDPVTYTFEITNTSSANSPDLVLDTISDTLLGDLADEAPAACDTLAPGESCSFQVVRTVVAGDPDPLPNTVTVHYHPQGFPNDVTDSDDHSVNLFQPSVVVRKGGNTTSKIGDPVTYTFEIENTSSSDSPSLVMDSITDTLLGNLADDAPASCDTLAPGAKCNFTVDRTVQAGDPDPLPNTVTVHYHPLGFPNDISDSDDHSVNLFGPTIEIVKSGDALSKVGDPVTYTFTITNTSTDDAPDLILDSIRDSVIGDLADEAPAACDALSPGESCTFQVVRTVQADDPDPLVNIVTVHYHPEGFPNDITDSDDHTVNLFQPAVSVAKGGDSLGKIGDPVTYTFTITNIGSSDSPNLILDSITDTLLGDLADDAPAACDSIAAGQSCSFEVTRTVLAGDPDPLPNTVTVHYHPQGFPNDITDSDDHSVELFQPGVTVEKTGDTLSKAGDQVTYSFTVTNTSSDDTPDLVIDSMSDSVLGDLEAKAIEAGCERLASGASCSFEVTRTVQPGDDDPLPNTVTVHYHPDGFPNDISDSDDHSVNLFQPSVTIDKAGPASVVAGQPLTYTFTITNTSSSDAPPLTLESVTDVGDGWAGLGDLTDEAIGAGCATLASGAACTFSVTITAPASPPTLRNTVSVLYHPQGFPNDIRDSDTHELGVTVVLGEKFARTGTDLGTFLALGIALVLAGLGLRFLVTWTTPEEA